MISRNDPCWCGSQKKWKKCHHPTPPPQSFEERQASYLSRHRILLKSPEEIEGIRAACTLAATILEKLCAAAKEGVTTQELDALSNRLHKEAGATPAALGYGTPPFPCGICTSLNEVICHGIPNEIPLKEGDILNIDVTSILEGFYGDCSRMVIIGEASIEAQLLVATAKECLERATHILRPGLPLYEIGKTIEDYATSQGFSVVDEFVAHGVGTSFHEPPQIFHCYNEMDIPLAAGMTFTIEPMINVGVRSSVIDPDDQWTARTSDGKLSAQWEHTLLITEEGYEVLTLPQ